MKKLFIGAMTVMSFGLVSAKEIKITVYGSGGTVIGSGATRICPNTATTVCATIAAIVVPGKGPNVERYIARGVEHVTGKEFRGEINPNGSTNEVMNFRYTK